MESKNESKVSDTSYNDAQNIKFNSSGEGVVTYRGFWPHGVSVPLCQYEGGYDLGGYGPQNQRIMLHDKTLFLTLTTLLKNCSRAPKPRQCKERIFCKAPWSTCELFCRKQLLLLIRKSLFITPCSNISETRWTRRSKNFVIGARIFVKF